MLREDGRCGLCRQEKARRRRTPALARLVLLGLAASLTWPAGVRSQEKEGDPVERLRRALQASYPSVAARADEVKQCLAGLRSLADLQRAVLLVEWRQADPGDPIAAVDRANQAVVMEWFAATVRDVLRRREPAAVAATIDLITQTASLAHASGEPAVLVRGFAPELAELVRQSPPVICQAAAQALGQIEPSVFIAVPALQQLLHADAAKLRLTAAEALGNLIQNALPTVGETGTASVRSAARGELILLASCVLSALHAGLDDARPEVRRRCVETIGQGAAVLSRLISDPLPSAAQDRNETAAARPPLQAEREELRPLFGALRDQGSILVRSLRDSDVEVRVLTYKALEELGHAQWRWTRRCSTEGATPNNPEDGLLREVLREAVPGLEEALVSPDVRVRRSAVDALEMFSSDALPAVPALARSLHDPDRFMRWSAIRILGKLGPPAADWAAPGLARLLQDPDVDLRRAAAAALARVNSPPQAEAPSSEVPIRDALLRSLEDRDADMRVAALHALRDLNSDARPLLPLFLRALSDPDAHVRQAAAETLGAWGPLARDAIQELRLALKDPEPEVRRAADVALLNIVSAPPR